MSVQRSPPAQLLSSSANTTTNLGDYYSSDSALNLPHNEVTDDYFNLSKNKRQKRSIEDLNLLPEDNADPTLMIIKALFDDFKEQQDLKFESVNNALTTLVTRTEAIKNTVDTLNNRHEEILSKMNTMEQENKVIRQRVEILENKIEQLERYTCSTSIEIRNIPKSDREDKKSLINSLTSLGSTIGLEKPIQMCEIKNIYRLKSDSIVADLSTTLRKEEIIVKYRAYNKRQREDKKPTLNSSDICALTLGPARPIFVSESLTTKARRVFFVAREHVKSKKITAAWTSYGKVYVKKEEGSPPIRIDHETDINKVVM